MRVREFEYSFHFVRSVELYDLVFSTGFTFYIIDGSFEDLTESPVYPFSIFILDEKYSNGICYKVSQSRFSMKIIGDIYNAFKRKWILEMLSNV